MAELDKLKTFALCNVTRFTGDGDGRDRSQAIEVVDWSKDEVELAFSFYRHRYYVRVRRDDLIRFAQIDSEEADNA